MAAWSEMGAQARVGVGVAAAAVVAIAVYFGFGAGAKQPEPAPEPELAAAAVPAAAPEVVAPEVVAPEVVAPEVAAPVAAAVPAEVEPAALKIDLVRVEADGAATIAGMAGAGDAIGFAMQGAELFATTADASGNFVGLFTIPPAAEARVLVVSAKTADGVARRVELAIAPIAAPQIVAAAEAPAAPPEAAPPAALLIAPEGVSVVQTDAAAETPPMGAVTLDTITYAPDGAVQLGGKGAAGSGLRIYLDQAAAAEGAVGADGNWQAVLQDVAAGLYTLRIDQLAADGKVTARFETPFKRETLQALAAVAAAQAPVVTKPAPAVTTEMPAVAAPEPAPTPEPAAEPSAVVVAPQTPAAVPEVAAEAPPAPEPAAVTTAAPKPAVTITVQPGFTLWGIAKQELGEGVMYVQVFNANKDQIKNPDLIYPGQVFTLPSAP
jgi:nucleoid-associated protein YgaU